MKTKSTKCYVVTVQLLVAAEDNAECSDAVSAVLSESANVIKDWTYLKVGGQYLSSGQEQYVDSQYEEGDAFR